MNEPQPDPELRDILAPLATIPKTEPALRDAVRERVRDSIDAAAKSDSGGSTAAGGARGYGGSTLLLVLAGGIAIGVGLGWTLSESQRPAKDPRSIETRPAETPPTEASAETQAAEMQAAETRPSAKTISASAPEVSPKVNGRGTGEVPRAAVSRGKRVSKTQPTQNTLAAERRLIDAAFALLKQGNIEEAVRALDRHQLQFPEGILAPERDALRQRLPRAMPQPR